MLQNAASAILMYHGIGEPDARSEDDYTLPRAELERHLDALARHEVISLDELLAGKPGVVLTFDDGERSVLTEAVPMLEERRLPAIAYISTAHLGEPCYLMHRDVALLATRNVMIGAHGHTHRPLSRLSDRELHDELARSRRILGNLLGKEVVHMSLPHGDGGRRVLAAAREAGYVSVATSAVGMNRAPPDAYALRRMPIRRGLPPARLAALCAGDLLACAPAMLRGYVLGAARGVLGATTYQRARSIVGRALARL